MTVVKQIPRVDGHNRQPTIAIITSMYHEKMAVDAMMTNRQTFVRYATVGELGREDTASHPHTKLCLCSNFLFVLSGFVFCVCLSRTQTRIRPLSFSPLT